MNKFYIFLALLYLPFQSHAQKYTPLELSVEQAFSKYQTSVMADDKEWPKNFTDSNSIAYYTQLLSLIKEADSTQLMKENHSKIISVLYARYLAPAGKFSSIHNAYELIYFLSQDVTKRSLAGIVVRDINVDDSTAVVYTSLPDNNDLVPYTFVLQQNGDWKLYLIADFDNIEIAIASPEFQSQFGSDKPKVIENIVRANGWNSTNKNLWLPQP